MSLIEGLRNRRTYLSTAEVIVLIGCTRNTLCAYVRARHIPAVRVGTSYLYDPGALADWLEARTTAPAKRAA